MSKSRGDRTEFRAIDDDLDVEAMLNVKESQTSDIVMRTVINDSVHNMNIVDKCTSV
jgi:hypothetical protein